MSAEPLQHLRTFITESFDAVAVNILSEVQSLVQCFEDENKRLRTLLHAVLQPEVQLTRIEISSSSLLGPRASGPGAQTRAVLSGPEVERPKEEEAERLIEEEQLKEEEEEQLIEEVQLKEEEMECAISDDAVDPVKAEPEVVPISASHGSRSSTLALNVSPCSSNTSSVSMTDDSSDDGEDEDAASIGPPPQKTLLECPRFKKPDATFLPTPREYKAFISRLTDIYKDVPQERRPLITLMGLGENVEFVDCALGKVPKGCPLSYHHPLPADSDFKPLADAPPQPRLPLQSQVLPPSNVPGLTASEQAVVGGMRVTWEAAYTLEQSTRQDKDIGSAAKNGRLVDCFRDVFSLKGAAGSAQQLVARMRRNKRKSKHATIERALRAEALREYCRLVCVNVYPCGLVVHPAAPWLAAHPHGLVYDPDEEVSFGIVRVKCEHSRSFVECKFIAFKEGALQVNAKNPCYWDIQGELLVTGTMWCDLLVFCGDDMLVQRLYRDEPVIDALKNKLDGFFFKYYLPSLCEEEGGDKDPGARLKTEPGLTWD